MQTSVLRLAASGLLLLTTMTGGAAAKLQITDSICETLKERGYECKKLDRTGLRYNFGTGDCPDAGSSCPLSV